MKSISRFLLIGLLVSVTSIATAVALWSYLDSSHEVEELFDAELAQMARVLQSLLEAQLNNVRVEPLIDSFQYRPFQPSDSGNSDEAQPLGHKYEQKLAFKVWNDSGKELLSSSKDPSLLSFSSEIGYRNEQIGGEQWRTFTLHDRSIQIWLTVAQRQDVRQELVSEIVRDLLLPLALMIPILGAVIWLVVNLGLAPLKKLSRHVRSRGSDNLNPISPKNHPRETLVLVEAVNDLLSRLEQAFERERRFSADAAHELRTPLAGVRIHAQNLSEELVNNAKVRPLLQGVDQMTHVVEQLLALSRVEHIDAQRRQHKSSLRTVTQQCMAELAPLALEKQQQLELLAEHDVDVKISSDSLKTTLQNILTNAIRYTPKHGRIEVCIVTIPQGAMVQISDNGPGIPKDDRSRVFERFYRLADQSITGSGLGLSIVKEVCAREDIRIELLDSQIAPTGLAVRLTFNDELIEP
ncbi:MAG: ATP-binding protein [Motiliproteus sp.]|nr:ATP-binding protein [Motiliproteus sp.]MCW9052631.1 ATP-binding protein [Motiliproteus sp.]